MDDELCIMLAKADALRRRLDEQEKQRRAAKVAEANEYGKE